MKFISQYWGGITCKQFIKCFNIGEELQVHSLLNVSLKKLKKYFDWKLNFENHKIMF